MWPDREKEPRICMCVGSKEKGGDGYGTSAMETIG
jgi:NAD(P)H-hydrate repair Nnr-like enzyme with NAD(P)H-hydrate epimerase domain